VSFDKQFDEVFGLDDREQAREYTLATETLRVFFLKAQHGMATCDDVESAKKAIKILGVNCGNE
jgi:hypothetical protein